MLFLFISLSLGIEIYARCNHDDIQKEIPNPFHEFSPSASIKSVKPRQPMRIAFDLMNVQKSGSKNFNNLNITLHNIADFASRLMKVDRLASPIKPPTSVSGILCSAKSVEADLFIAVTTKRYNKADKILGQAFYTKVNFDNRPIIGGMYLNEDYFPEEPQDEHSLERLFFTTIFHELCHVFGISNYAFSRWINKTSGAPYTKVRSTYFNSTYNKIFNILHTPKAHQYAVERFGIEEFAPGIPSGIEIEDGGGSGTEGSHPESRVYLSETMCGIFVGYTFISNLTLAMLEDTGWYDVNYSMGELYPWGDGKSLGPRTTNPSETPHVQPLTNFINTAPQLAYPPHYLCWPGSEEKDLCHYDFRSKAYCSPLTAFNCDKPVNADDRKCCSMKPFTNPLNWPIRGDREEFDYLIFKVPNVSLRCQDRSLNYDPGTGKTGEYYSDDSMCAMSTLQKKPNDQLEESQAPERDEDHEFPGCYKMMCNQMNELFITVGDEMKRCESNEQRLTFSGMTGYLLCPDPMLLCGMKTFIKRPTLEEAELNNYTEAPYELPTKNKEVTPSPSISENHVTSSTKESSIQSIFILVVGIVIGALISIVIMFIMKKFFFTNYGEINKNIEQIEHNEKDEVHINETDSSSEHI